MMKENTNQQRLIICLVGIIPVVWLALVIAPYINDGLVGIINNSSKSLEEPFNIKVCEHSLKNMVLPNGVIQKEYVESMKKRIVTIIKF